eukprot:293531-Amorphochlora_amoeboformis.AAC.1
MRLVCQKGFGTQVARNRRNPWVPEEERKFPTTAQKLSIIIRHNPNGQMSTLGYYTSALPEFIAYEQIIGELERTYLGITEPLH